MSATTGKQTVVGRWVVGIAVAVTIVIALGAFWLSFAALTDLAYRSGIPAAQAWVWPVIVDGMIVAGTVAIVAMSGHEARARRYPWAVLTGGAVVSVSANASHAVIAGPADQGVPVVVAALVGAVAPVALLVITHLTVLLTRKAAPPKPTRRRAPAPRPSPAPTLEPVVAQAASEQSLYGELDPKRVVPPLHLVEQEAPEDGGGSRDGLEEWVRERTARGATVSGPAAVQAGLAPSESTARRRLRELRETSPELFGVDVAKVSGRD